MANWEQHILPDVLGKTKTELDALLGVPVPANVRPSHEYRGPLRIVVLPARTRANAGAPVNLKALILSITPVRSVSLQWRPLGRGTFRTEPFTHVARGVYTARLPVRNEDLEYGVMALTEDRAVAMWPASAASFGQTLVVTAVPAARQLRTALHIADR